MKRPYIGSLFDRRAPLFQRSFSTRHSQPWYDARLKLRRLERVYHRSRSPTSLANWGQQFQSQRELFERKTCDFWLSASNSHRSDPSKLHVDNINMLHAATDHANKIERIRASTAGAAQPLLTQALVVRSIIIVFTSYRCRSNQTVNQCVSQTLLLGPCAKLARKTMCCSIGTKDRSTLQCFISVKLSAVNTECYCVSQAQEADSQP
jgi:hypothetical protein